MKIGRDAKDGRFIPVAKAQANKAGAVVENIKRPAPKPKAAPKKK